MSRNIAFTIATLPAGKRGILKPDDDGYYPQPLGALNTFNSIGEYYVRKEAESLFAPGSSLMRRLTNRRLKAELGHPDQAPGMNDSAYMYRVQEIRESMVCGVFKKIVLDFDYAEELRRSSNTPRPLGVAAQHQGDLIPIIGWIKPAGPYAGDLQRGYDNPDEDVCFSVRGFTDDYYAGGINYRILREIITWDKVGEPGIANATKYTSPTLESFLHKPITAGIITDLTSPAFASMATEDSREITREIIKLYNRSNPAVKASAWDGW